MCAGWVRCPQQPLSIRKPNLSREGRVHEAPEHASKKLLAECTNHLKTYKKNCLGTIRYEQIGSLSFSPGFTCHVRFLPPSGYKLKSYVASVVSIHNGVRQTNPPSYLERLFLLCEFAQVKYKVVFARWHVGGYGHESSLRSKMRARRSIKELEATCSVFAAIWLSLPAAFFVFCDDAPRER